MEKVCFPLSTGQVCELLKVAEHSVTNQIRLNKVRPSIVCGRRAWSRDDVLRVAHILGRDTAEVQNMCRQPEQHTN